MEIKNPRKPLIYYIITVLFIVLILNTFVIPGFLKRHVIQVDYGYFLRELEAGRISKVEIQEKQVVFAVRNENGKENIYITGRMDDPDLVNRLYEANVIFNRLIPRRIPRSWIFFYTGFCPCLSLSAWASFSPGGCRVRWADWETPCLLAKAMPGFI